MSRPHRLRQPWSDDRWVRVFLTRVEKTPSGCWRWTGMQNGRTDTGGQYGFVRRHGRMQYAHRAYYEYDRGRVPDGMELDHLCRDRLCVNPEHLEPVTHSENILRGKLPNAEATHCKRGHAYTDDNTSIVQRGNGRTYRRCRSCHAANQRRRVKGQAVGTAMKGAQ